MANPLRPVSQKQAVITISAISGVQWTAVRGGRVNREEIKYNDGKEGIEKTLVGFLNLENITLMKPFDPAADKEVLSWIDGQYKSPVEFNVAIQPVKPDLTGSPVEGSSQILYSNCQLKSHKLPDWDRNASGLAMIELEIIFNSLPTYQ